MEQQPRHDPADPDRFALDLAAARADCLRLIEEGARRPESPFHLPVLGTVRNGTSELRTVVLREAHAAGRRLICYADARSPKVADLGANPAATWLFYDPDRRVQVRAHGGAGLHTTDAIADRHWDRVPAEARWLYQMEAPAGTPLPAAAAADLSAVPGQSDGRANFAVITTRIEALDWLYLDRRGHRRARFRWSGEHWESAWVMP